MLSLRPASPSDAETLTSLAVRSEAHWGYDSEFLDTFREVYRVTESFIRENPTFVAEENGAPVGFYALVSEEMETTLEYMYLDPDHIRKGYGRALWEHMTAQARGLGLKEVHLVCSPEPKAFYLKMGAVETGEQDSRVLPGRKVSRLRYPLAKDKTP